MPNVVEVVEKEVLLPYLVSSFDMNVYIITLGVSAVVMVNTYDKDGRQLYNKQIIIEGDEYQAWSNDDNYIRLLVASKLGLVIKTLY
jgi:hypothetical protein